MDNSGVNVVKDDVNGCLRNIDGFVSDLEKIENKIDNLSNVPYSLRHLSGAVDSDIAATKKIKGNIVKWQDNFKKLSNTVDTVDSSNADLFADSEEETDDNSFWDNALNVVKRTGATIAVGATSLLSGVLSIGEEIIDGAATIVGCTASLLGADEFTNKVMDFVATDYVGELNKDFYEGTSLGRSINDASYMAYDSEAANKIQQVGKKAGELALAVATGGMGTAVTVGAFALQGLGQAAQVEYQKPDDERQVFTASMALGTAAGAMKGLFYSRVASNITNMVSTIQTGGIAAAKEAVAANFVSGGGIKGLAKYVFLSKDAAIDATISGVQVGLEGVSQYKATGAVDVGKLAGSFAYQFGLARLTDVALGLTGAKAPSWSSGDVVIKNADGSEVLVASGSGTAGATESSASGTNKRFSLKDLFNEKSDTDVIKNADGSWVYVGKVDDIASTVSKAAEETSDVVAKVDDVADVADDLARPRNNTAGSVVEVSDAYKAAAASKAAEAAEEVSDVVAKADDVAEVAEGADGVASTAAASGAASGASSTSFVSTIKKLFKKSEPDAFGTADGSMVYVGKADDIASTAGEVSGAAAKADDIASTASKAAESADGVASTAAASTSSSSSFASKIRDLFTRKSDTGITVNSDGSWVPPATLDDLADVASSTGAAKAADAAAAAEKVLDSGSDSASLIGNIFSKLGSLGNTTTGKILGAGALVASGFTLSSLFTSHNTDDATTLDPTLATSADSGDQQTPSTSDGDTSNGNNGNNGNYYGGGGGSPGGSYNGDSSGGTNDSDDNNASDKNSSNDNNTNNDTDSTPKTSSEYASSLVGKTMPELKADTSNGIYDTDNYAEGEDWNSKFIHDVINRDEDNQGLMDDYYKNTESYPDPYDNPDSLVKFAQDEESNMEFNWSDSSLDKIKDSTETTGGESYTPKEGDVVFLDNSDTDGNFNGDINDASSVDTLGIVTKVENYVDSDGVSRTKLTVVQGNGDITENGSIDSGKVISKEYYVEDEKIVGYGTISKDASKGNGSTISKQENNTNNNNDSNNNNNNNEDSPDKTYNNDVILDDNDYVESESNDNVNTFDSEGIQRDSNDNIIGKVEISKNNEGNSIITEDEIQNNIKDSNPSSEQTNNQNENIDMSNYDNGIFDDLNLNNIIWDWEDENKKE